MKIVIKKRFILFIVILLSALITGIYILHSPNDKSIFSIKGTETTKALTDSSITIDWGDEVGSYGNVTGLYVSNNSVRAIIDGSPRWELSVEGEGYNIVKASNSDFLGLFTNSGVQVVSKNGYLCNPFTMRNISC